MLIACANVTNLLLVRVEARQQELAVRTALGAGRARIVRGLLVESVMLGIMGGVVGVGLAYAGVRFLVAIGPSNLPRLNEIAIDARTLAIHFCPFGAVRLVVWIDSGSEICRTTQHLGPPKRGANDQREPGAASGAESAGCWAGGNGAGAVDECRPDDSHIRSLAKGRSGICRSAATCRRYEFRFRNR